MKKKKAKIKKIKPRKVEKLPDGDLLIDAELVVAGAPDPPIDPLPSEIDFDMPSDPPERTGWQKFFDYFR